MIEPKFVHEKPDYTYNLLSELKEFYDTEVKPIMEVFGVQKNPYPVGDYRYNDWQKEYNFWKTNNPQQ